MQIYRIRREYIDFARNVQEFVGICKICGNRKASTRIFRIGLVYVFGIHQTSWENPQDPQDFVPIRIIWMESTGFHKNQSIWFSNNSKDLEGIHCVWLEFLDLLGISGFDRESVEFNWNPEHMIGIHPTWMELIGFGLNSGIFLESQGFCWNC